MSLEPVTKVSDELKKMLQEAIARELSVSISYMWQHVQISGVKAYAVKNVFKETAITEMKHAEAIAERLFYLGEKPTTKPTEIKIGEGLKEYLEIDAKLEEDAIKFYKEIIKKAESEGDYTTANLFKGILADEEEHHDIFTTILEEL